VKYRETRCDTRSLSSVAFVHGFASTLYGGISQRLSRDIAEYCLLDESAQELVVEGPC
jgi:hypothetical protein